MASLVTPHMYRFLPHTCRIVYGSVNLKRPKLFGAKDSETVLLHEQERAVENGVYLYTGQMLIRCGPPQLYGYIVKGSDTSAFLCVTYPGNVDKESLQFVPVHSNTRPHIRPFFKTDPNDEGEVGPKQNEFFRGVSKNEECHFKTTKMPASSFGVTHDNDDDDFDELDTSHHDLDHEELDFLENMASIKTRPL